MWKLFNKTKPKETGERLYDIGQNRTNDVIAWRKNPKPYMKGFKKTSIA